MRPSEALNLHRAGIRRIVSSHHATNPRVFGSAVRGEDTEASDLDILVDGLAGLSLRDLARIEMEIEDLTGLAKIDVVPSSFFSSAHIRDRVLREAQPI